MSDVRMRAGAIYLYERQLENMKAALFHLEAADAAFKACNTHLHDHSILNDDAWGQLKAQIIACERRINSMKEGLAHDIEAATEGDEE